MSSGKVYVGIDIGGTNTKIALVDSNGGYTCLNRIFYGESGLSLDLFLQKVTVEVAQLAAANEGNLSGIGISSPGLQMENGHGTLNSVNMPILNEFDLKNFFEDRFHLPAVVNNDLVAHSLAESRFGLGKGVDRFLSVSMGTGIGHTFIYKGKPQLIMNGISGDSGRMIIDPVSTIVDSSGVYGSAEALCGVRAIELLAKEHYTGEKHYSAQEVISKAHDENEVTAIKIMTVISHRLALLLINLSTIYFPEVISITGGQTEAGPFFIEECQKEFDRRVSVFFDDIARSRGQEHGICIHKSRTGGLTGLIGSIVPFLD